MVFNSKKREKGNTKITISRDLTKCIMICTQHGTQHSFPKEIFLYVGAWRDTHTAKENFRHSSQKASICVNDKSLL